MIELKVEIAKFIGFAILLWGCSSDYPLSSCLPKEIVNQKDNSVMALVPEGEFLMGTSDADLEFYRKEFPLEAESTFADERPQHKVFLDAFYIDKFEITNEQYQAFLKATAYKAKSYLDESPYNDPNLPAVVLEWEDVVAYAKWAEKRIPTEAEWEKAARGTDGRIWPWGNEWNPSILNANDGDGSLDGYAQTAPVGQYPKSASPYGVYDLAGNIWEWVADWYDPNYYKTSPYKNPKGPRSGSSRILRGGGWAENYEFTRCASRLGGINFGSLLRGFRCAKDAE